MISCDLEYIPNFYHLLFVSCLPPIARLAIDTTCHCHALIIAPVTAIGLIASIGTLLDYGGKLVGRLVEYQASVSGVPQAFTGIEINLPLILDALKRISNQTKDGRVGDETRRAPMPVILSCHSLIKALHEILTKIVALATDHMLERGIKAAQSIRKEREIDRLVNQLTERLSTLVFHSLRALACRSHPGIPSRAYFPCLLSVTRTMSTDPA